MLGERVQGALDRWAYLWLQGVQVTCGDWWPLVPTDMDNGQLGAAHRRQGPATGRAAGGREGASGAFFSLLLLLLSPFSRVRLCATPETAAHQAPPYPGFSRQECWSGLPFPSPVHANKVTQSYQTLATPWLQPSLPAPTRGRGHTPSSSLVLGPPPARPTSQTPTGSSGLHPLPQLKRVEPSCGGAWGQPLRGPLHPSAACRLGNGLGVRVAS